MMRPGAHITIRFLAVFLTIFFIVAREYLPLRVIQLYPDPNRISWIYGPDRQGGPSTGWIDQDAGHLWCNFDVGDPYACGWSINLGPDRTTGLDLSDVDGFNILMHYSGDSPWLRLYLRDFDPAYSDIDRYDVSSKVMSTAIRTSDLNKPTHVRLSEFSVAEWWITEFNIARENSAPSLENVIVFGFEFIVHSQNEIRIEKIEAVGEWIKKETLYFGIIAAWMTLIIFEMLMRFYVIRKKAIADAARLDLLADECKKLELEKQEFEELSTTDILTGVMNRAGVQQSLPQLFEGEIGGNNVGILLFDIDHFKNVNDRFGHDAGDRVLTGVAKIINQSIRQTDVFGRWGGEEFILLCPNIPPENLKNLAEKIRDSVALHTFSVSDKRVQVTLSVGATTVNVRDGFHTGFKRADDALYKAKNSGRNRVCLAP